MVYSTHVAGSFIVGLSWMLQICTGSPSGASDSARLKRDCISCRVVSALKSELQLHLRVVERCGRIESTTVGERTVRVSRDSIWNCARLRRSAMRFSFTPAPRATSMRLRMAASSASFAACKDLHHFCQ